MIPRNMRKKRGNEGHEKHEKHGKHNKHSRHDSERRIERILQKIFLLCALIPAILLFIIFSYVFINGKDAITLDFLLEPPYMMYKGGIFPQIIGSLCLVSVCLLFAVPVGVLSAIYLSEYAPENALTSAIRFLIECLAGIPSIVIGLFGLILLVHYLKFRISLLSGGISLGFMILPWTIRASEEAIRAVPRSYREAAFALGATKLQTVRAVVLRNAYPGIITGVLLGVGKALGETAVVLLTTSSGIQSFLPRSVFDQADSLPVYIYIIATQGAHLSTAFMKASGASLVLLTMFFLINISALLLRNRYIKRIYGEIA